MRTSIVSVALTLMVLPGTRGEEATLGDGQKRSGTLTFREGQLHFAEGERTIPMNKIHSILFAPAHVIPPRVGLIHRVELGNEQSLSGELLQLDGDGVRMRTSWSEALFVPRSALRGLAQPSGQLIVHDEGFEEQIDGWKLEGSPRPQVVHHASGTRALRLSDSGPSATWALPEPLESGKVGVNIEREEGKTAARWLLEMEFAEKEGKQAVRVGLSEEQDKYMVEAPWPRDEGVEVKRQPGWQRLVVEFTPETLLVTVDERLVWFTRQRRAGGSLRQVRLLNAAASEEKPPTGQVTFDEFSVVRSAKLLSRPIGTTTREEVWLASGDQLFGKILGADRKGLKIEASFGKRHLTWARVRGVYLPSPARGKRTGEGEQVRLWLRPAAGNLPDELEGVLAGFDEEQVTLRHAVLGEVKIPRAMVQRLRPIALEERLGRDTRKE